MKKLTAILLVHLFLITNTGMAITMHWCGGKLTSIDLFSSGHSCSCGKKAMKKDCCKDKTAFLKIKDDLTKANSLVLKISTPKILISFVKQIDVLLSAQHQYWVSDFYHPPPFKPKAPLYLLDRVFLI